MKHLKLILATAFVLLTMALAACSPEQGYNNNYQGNDYDKKEENKPAQEYKKDDYYVKTTEIDYKGEKKIALTDYRGYTLYYFTEDTADVKCTGACAQTWPPYVYKNEGEIKYAATITGKVGYVKNEYGYHVTYNGHYLYTYSGDTAPGEYKGDGKNGTWYVAWYDLPGK